MVERPVVPSQTTPLRRPGIVEEYHNPTHIQRAISLAEDYSIAYRITNFRPCSFRNRQSYTGINFALRVGMSSYGV